MNVDDYIASGILELYVAGVLSEQENTTVAAAMATYPKIREEVLAIEASISSLTAAVAAGQKTPDFDNLKTAIQSSKQTKVKTLDTQKKSTNWFAYLGWAASIALLIGLWTQYRQNANLKYEVSAQEMKNTVLETEITSMRAELKSTSELVAIFRDQNIKVINLDGQEVAPNTYAKAFWHTVNQVVYIDAVGLPVPPKGKVYQVWSLTLNPLTPTSLGLLNDFESDDNKLFSLSNLNTSEAFGITLEPEGGSESPTMERLFTLGIVKS